MKVLVVGGGGREHAIVWKLVQSRQVNKIFCAPGNAGTSTLAENISISPEDITNLLSFAQKQKIDITIIGPEAPLALGISDLFSQYQMPCFGPTRAGAMLESSKIFSKRLMEKYRIPTAKGRFFFNIKDAYNYLEEIKTPVVIKADGLAAGKGVVVAETLREAKEFIQQVMEERIFGEAGSKIIIEEVLSGEEVSLMVFTDGETAVPMISAQDHKRVYDGDQGPNTGGMGAYSPAPILTPELLNRVENEILRPTIMALCEEGILYKGVLYLGLMITDSGPKVLEFNSRFGDPECQVVLPALKTDFLEVIKAIVDGNLKNLSIDWHGDSFVCVVLASGGYPGSYKKGVPIYGLKEAQKMEDIYLFHAGTSITDNQVVTSGGRVLGVTAKGHNIKEAIAKAYRAVESISFAGMHYRKDIGFRAISKDV